MFTGIIQTLGRVTRLEPRGGDLRLSIHAAALEFSDVRLGDSIAVSGVCLTVVTLDGATFSADVSNETLACTTLGTLAGGAAVNLEKALRLADRLGGHLVSGHVDGVGKVAAVHADGRSQRWTFEAPAELARYIAAKGSICIEGVSLTVNEIDGARFGINLIPHTQEQTTFHALRVGSMVNLEVDLIARYVERLHGLTPSLPAPGSVVDAAFLREHGFV